MCLHKDGKKFMIIVSIGIIFVAAGIAFGIAMAIAAPIVDMLKDMRDVAGFRLEVVTKRYTTGH
eukprot:gene1783-2144_t